MDGNTHLSHNVEAFQNGVYPNQFESIYPDARDHGYEPNWGFASNDNLANASGANPPLYSTWPQTNVPNSALEAYGRPTSRSPSFSQHDPYSNYADPRQFQQSPYDPSLVSQVATGQQYGPGQSPYGLSPSISGTIAPHALEHQPVRLDPGTVYNQQAYRRGSQEQDAVPHTSGQLPSVDQSALCAAIPGSTVSGDFAVVGLDSLSKATNSTRMHTFLNVSRKDFEYPINRAALPNPPHRRSRNELRRLANGDTKLLAKIGKKQSRKTHSLHGAVTANSARPASKTSPGASPSDYSSSEESSDAESEDELNEHSPLPGKRPDNPLEAVRYDSIKATWRSNRRDVSSAEIRSGLKDYWEVVRTIRDRWKTDTDAVAKAEEKNRIGELPLLRSRVKDQRDMIEVALRAALDHGHRAILELSGENAAFLYLCYQFLLERFKDNDMDGPLPRSILEILALCTTLSEEQLTKTHLVKVLPRFNKKGNAETRTLVKRIETAAEQGTKKKLEGAKCEPSADPKAAQVLVKAPEQVAGVKRAAPGNAASTQPAKKVASVVGGSPTAGTVTTKVGTGVVKRTIMSTGMSKPATSLNPTGPAVKSKAAAAKPSAFFTGLQSAPKKTTAVPAVKPAAAAVAAAITKPVESKTAASAPAMSSAKPTFSFADTMKNLTKPKPKAPSPKPEQQTPAETHQERQRRLRKESRRSLRVTFKPESALVEVRYFTHDPEEELGHDSSMTRDVGDVGGEGRMFKQHKDMMDVDEEDDGLGELEYKEYTEPSLIDFSTVDKDERDRNYAPFGGGTQKPESAETATREHYESSTLIVFYSHASEIPPSPKEPGDPYNGEAVTTKDFGAPSGAAATRAAQHASLAPQTNLATPTVDIQAILAQLNPQLQQIQQPQAPQLSQTQPTIDLSQYLARLGQNTAAQPPTQQLQAPTNPVQSVLPQSLQNIFASLQGNNPNEGQAHHAITQPAVQGANSTPDLASLLGHYGQSSATSAVPNPASLGALGFSGVPAGQMSQQQQSMYENEERRLWREQGGQDRFDDDESPDKNQFRKTKNWGETKSWGADKRFTLPCKYYSLGKCVKGAKCTYLHT